MPVLRFLPVTLLVAIQVVKIATAGAQDYPSKPIRIVTTPAGAAGDLVSRFIAQTIAAPLGQPVIVDNRPGVTAMENVAKSSPDGYSLLSMPNNFWFLPLMQTVSYDPVRDFLPIAMMANSPNVLVVHPSLPSRSVKDLIELARARPGQLNYAAGSAGSASDLAAALFKSIAGINVVHIPYKSNAAAMVDVMAGEVQFAFANMGQVAAHLKSGRLRILGVTTAEPTALVPGVPTIASAGLQGFESSASYGMYAPAATPAAIINRLNQELLRALNRPESKERLFNAGIEVIVSSPEQLGQKMKSEIARMGKVIKDANIRTE